MTLHSSQIAQFLRDELQISEDAIPVLLKDSHSPSRLAVTLWQQKLVTLTQLDALLHCLEPYVTAGTSLSWCQSH